MGTRIALTFAAAFALAALSSCSDDDPKPADAAVDGDNVDAAMVCSGGTKMYLQACTGDAECGDCMCKSFGHSMVCTKACPGGDGDCPAPSGGCTSGFCRP